MNYIYFVSYSHTNGFGNIKVETSEKIDDFETLEEIRKLLVEKRITKTSNN